MERQKTLSKNWWVYVLRLEEGKYYVGITSQTPEKRMQEHINHQHGAYWTMKYKPLEIIEMRKLGELTREEAEAIENIRTRQLMKEFGINNVRGGDITMTSNLIRRFGYYIDTWEWEAITTVVLLGLGNLILTVLYILK